MTPIASSTDSTSYITNLRDSIVPADPSLKNEHKTESTPNNEHKRQIPTDTVTLSGKTEEDPQIQAEIARLKSIEEKVKSHEASHKSAGGALAGSVSYTYTRGPDGRSYITGGEVQIDVSGGQTPQETVSRMEQVVRAALAPSDPSPQDRAVAQQASLEAMRARQEQSSQQQKTLESPENSKDSTGSIPTSTPSNNSEARRAYADPAVQPATNPSDIFAAISPSVISTQA